MRSRRQRVFGIGVALVVASFAAPAPAGAATETTFDETCAEVYGKRARGDLDKVTDPSPGTGVISGQRVTVTLEWPTFAVAGQRNHRVMECLSIDGEAPRLWAEHRFTSAEGTVSLSAVVPDGVSSKSAVCGQSFLKTQGSFGPVTRWSEKTCYPAGKSRSFSALARSPSPPSERSAPENRSTPTTRAPLFSPPSQSPSPSPPSSSTNPDDYQPPPWPPWEKTPRVSASPPATTVTTTAAVERTPATRRSAAEEAAPATSPASAPSNALPRTGAGIVVLLGIAAVALFSGRTLRRASYAIEDHLPVEAVPVDDEDYDPTLVLGRRWY
jgi:hypothetical protein